MRAVRAFCSLVIIGLLINLTAQADYLPLRADVNTERPQIEILEHSSDRVLFEVKLPGLDLLQEELQGERWDRIAFAGGYSDSRLGEPEIPHLTKLIAIPPNAGVRVEFEALESHVFDNIRLMPAQERELRELNSNLQPIQWDMAAYAQNALLPETDATAGEPALLRGVRVAPITMNPLRYNPATGALQVVHRYRVTVHFEGSDLRNTPSRAVRPISRSWAKVMRSLIPNFDELNIEEVPMGSYLIV
ncbi:MAG: C25 family peptidase propeptide domain-containing protein [bacterium]